MYQLQKVYALFLNSIYKVTGSIDERIRNAIITLCCVFLSGFFIAYYDNADPFHLYAQHTKNNIICGAVLIILVLCSIKEPLKEVKWDPCLFYTFFLAGAGIVVISFFHTVGSGYRSFGLMMMVGFPCLYFVWNNRKDYDSLFIRLSAASSATGLFFAIVCIRLAMTGDLACPGMRVCAFLENANLFSMVGMVMVCSSLYLYVVKRDSFLWFIFNTVSFAVGWEIVILGVSRVSILVCVGGMVALSIFSIKNGKTVFPAKGHLGSYLKALFVLVFFVVILLTGSALMKNNITLINERGAEINEQASGSDEIRSAGDRFSVEGKDLNTYTAGRISIWKGYIRHLNMWGNDVSKTDYKELTGSTVSHAHNNFLEYAYRCGVPVACVHIVLELYAGIVCLAFLFRKKYRQPFYFFAVVFMICYAVESMFDIATLPFERQAPFYFYMALIPLFGRFNDAAAEDAVMDQEN